MLHHAADLLQRNMTPRSEVKHTYVCLRRSSIESAAPDRRAIMDPLTCTADNLVCWPVGAEQIFKDFEWADVTAPCQDSLRTLSHCAGALYESKAVLSQSHTCLSHHAMTDGSAAHPAWDGHLWLCDVALDPILSNLHNRRSWIQVQLRFSLSSGLNSANDVQSSTV